MVISLEVIQLNRGVEVVCNMSIDDIYNRKL